MVSGRLWARVACLGAAGWWVVAIAANAEGFRSPEKDAAVLAGTTVSVAWEASCGRAESDEIELVLSLDDGITFPVRITPELPRCASRFEWRIPSLPTSAARLALRTGKEGNRESERIAFVSERFVILPEGEPAGAGLTRGAIEWWTDQALFDIAAEDWLGEAMTRRPAWHASAECESDADQTGPEPMPTPAPGRERLFASASVERRLSRPPAGLRFPAPIPMRV